MRYAYRVTWVERTDWAGGNRAVARERIYPDYGRAARKVRDLEQAGKVAELRRSRVEWESMEVES